MEQWLTDQGDKLLGDPDLTREEQEELFDLLQAATIKTYVEYGAMELKTLSGKTWLTMCPHHLDEWYKEQMELISRDYRLTDVDAEQFKALFASVLLVDYLGYAAIVLKSASGLTRRIQIPGDRPPESKEVAWPIAQSFTWEADAARVSRLLLIGAVLLFGLLKIHFRHAAGGGWTFGDR